MKTGQLRKLISLVVASLAPVSIACAAATTTPIKHVIVVVGENVTFDTLFATHIPAAGQSITNLLSQGIVNADGTPGPRYHKAVQKKAINENATYSINPDRTDTYDQLPTPSMIGLLDPTTFQFAGPVPDPRFASLDLNGPFQITKFVSYYTGLGDPVHRFFQMWQQTGGDNRHPDLFTWTASTAGMGNESDGVTADNPGQGGEQMGFFNMAQGDAPYFNFLAKTYASSDNFHQSIMGGTGANFFAIATGDVAVFQRDGVLATPPESQIENPDPQFGLSNPNFFTHDGYSGGSYVNCSDNAQPGVAAIAHFLGEKEIPKNCEPGAYYLVNNYDPAYNMDGTLKLGSNGTPKFEDATAHVYPPQTRRTIGELLSEHNVSWKWYTGGRDDADATSDALYPLVYAQVYPKVAAQVKMQLAAYFPAGVPDAIVSTYATPVATKYAISTTKTYLYNNLGDPLNASENIVNGPLHDNLMGLSTFSADVSGGTLPEVSFVVPKNLDSGHPGYSAPARYEAFLSNLVAEVQANPELYASTAIIITTDEGGGYFDSGRIQSLDFFGDGPRIPLLIVSPYAKPGHVDHTYYDHASILKFIERNWNLPHLSDRSRDNLPNPEKKEGEKSDDDRVIGDLMNMFSFNNKHH